MASPSTTNDPYPSSEIDVWNFVHDSLTGNNYEQWRQQMHDLIEKEKLVGFIDGTTKAPPKKDSESENYRSWKRSDDLLQKWIRTTLAEDICREVKRVRTAKGLWTKLEKWFGKPIIITSSSMASSSSSTRNSSSTIVEYPVVSKFVNKTLSVSENNYSEWRQQMYSLIKSKGLVDLVRGAVEAPAKRVTFTISDAAGCGDKAVKEIETEHYISWKRSDAQLQAWIRTTLSTDIPEHVVLSRSAKSMWTKLERIFGHYVPLHKAAIEGDWVTANKFIEQEPDIAIRAGITEDSETMLIVAVKSKRRNNFVRNLVELMLPEDLALGDTGKRTALHRAAGAGNIEAAKLLVTKNPYLPNAQTYNKRIPLFFAAARAHRKMVLYLLSVTTGESRPMSSTTFLSQLLSANGFSPRSIGQDDRTRMGIEEFRWNPTPFDGESGFRILHQLTSNGFYDIALALLQDKPRMAHFIPAPKEKQNDIDFHSLLALARKPSSFPSGTSFNWFQSFIYSVVPVTLENNADHRSTGDTENPAGCFTSSGAHAKNILQWMIGKITDLLPCRKHIEGKKRLHDQAFKLVKFLCNKIANSNHSNAIKIFQLALFQATSLGIVEIVEEILRSYPYAISLQNQKKQSIFHQAIVYRREKVFNLLCQMESRTIFLSQLDESNNNALHLAGYMAPQQQLYLRTGAAQQMQRELHWFKEVEKLVVPRSKEERNDRKMTPEEVFIDTHKDLAKEGERSMKDTANACTIVAALIATVAFAAAITVPGGNNSDGNPNFYKQRDFIIFGIFDALAFLLSLTSLLSFMSIHTHSFQYGEHDFLVSLHKIFIVGLYTLFLCILSTVAAFHATLYLVFGERNKPRIIILIFAYCAYMPAVFFVLLNFPLIADMIKSIIFVKGSDVKLS